MLSVTVTVVCLKKFRHSALEMRSSSTSCSTGERSPPGGGVIIYNIGFVKRSRRDADELTKYDCWIVAYDESKSRKSNGNNNGIMLIITKKRLYQ